MTYFHLSPLLKSRAGFDAFSDIFNHINVGATSYPSYNIEKFDDNHFAIVMNVAGFTDEDLDIELEGTVLNVSATLDEEATNSDENAETEKQYLHQGIFNNAFNRQFNVPDHVEIIGAELNHGLLTISLERKIPEAMKPRKIAINNNSGTKDFKAA
ncbi:MAG: Hsp20 family protein [Alphaproteobacteria bacterium]|nr:Hsp20 family protein [Alphaproteobacteria bacterium]